MGKRIESAVNWAVGTANDNSHGYDQINRQGPDYDCSSLVINAWENAGVLVRENGATYTGNMKKAFVACGFEAIPAKDTLPPLKRGDVLLNEKHHTCMYLGEGKVVQASINELGKTTGGKSGDQTGKEINISPLYVPSYKWDFVLRYKEDEAIKAIKMVTVQLPELSMGSVGPAVGTLQVLLNSLGFKGKNGKVLTVDDCFGQNVAFAVHNAQVSFGLNPDEVVGSRTWPAFLGVDY